MADALVDGVDDRLSVGSDLVHIAIKIQHPPKRLLRRRDVVAFGTEHDDRRLDVTQIDYFAVGGFDPPCSEIVADKELIDNELDLLGIEVDVTAPPALEFEIALRFCVYLGINVLLLGPERVRRIHVLEILNQPCAVELAAAEIACQRRQPASAEQSARIAHRILAPDTGPV